MNLAFAPEQIETWPLDRLKPYANNAKAHGDDQVTKIAASMAEFGWTVPVLVAGDGEVIAGHGRILAAEQLGLTEAPVIVLGHMSEAQRRAYRIADNKLTELGAWDEELLSVELTALDDIDFDLNLLGFETLELDRLVAGDDGEAAGDGEEESVPEPPKNPVTRPGDLWLLGDHRLMCGDSRSAQDVRRLMNGERATLFATDPPYLVGYSGGDHPDTPGRPERSKRNKDWSDSDGKSWDGADENSDLYSRFIDTAMAEAIGERAAWYCWHASAMQCMVRAEWEKAGAFVHQQIIWVKPNPVLTYADYLWGHEPCFYGWLRGKKPKVLKAKTPEGKAYTTIWHMHQISNNMQKKESIDHPTPKPLEAFGIPMRRHVARGGLCYEPFCGSGSQIVAGEENARRVFAMEIAPQYVDVAVERWQRFTGKDAVLDGAQQTFSQVHRDRLECDDGKTP